MSSVLSYPAKLITSSISVVCKTQAKCRPPQLFTVVLVRRWRSLTVSTTTASTTGGSTAGTGGPTTPSSPVRVRRCYHHFLLVRDIFPLSFSPFFCPLFLSYNDHCSAAGCEYKFGLFPKDEGCHSSYIKCEHGKPTEVCKMKLFFAISKKYLFRCRCRARRRTRTCLWSWGWRTTRRCTPATGRTSSCTGAATRQRGWGASPAPPSQVTPPPPVLFHSS